MQSMFWSRCKLSVYTNVIATFEQMQAIWEWDIITISYFQKRDKLHKTYFGQ